MDRKPTFFHIAASSILLLFLQGQPADASPTYRWVDDNGNPVLSDRPPPTGKPYTEIEIKIGLKRYAKSTTAVPEPPSVTTELTAQQGTALAVTDVNESVLPSASLDECAALDTDIERLTNYPRIIVRDEVGEEHLLSPEERATRLEKALAFAETFCRR
jgi:hypothetical protein